MSFPGDMRSRGQLERRGRSRLGTGEAQGPGGELGTGTKPASSCPDIGPQQPLRLRQGRFQKKMKQSFGSRFKMLLLNKLAKAIMHKFLKKISWKTMVFFRFFNLKIYQTEEFHKISWQSQE